jgi:hypothetical protein
LRGSKKGAKATPAQLAALARSHATRDANRHVNILCASGRHHLYKNQQNNNSKQ